MTELLSPEELADLTGYRDRAKQRAELERLGIPYLVARGRPRVSRAIMRDVMAGRPVQRSSDVRLDLVR